MNYILFSGLNKFANKNVDKGLAAEEKYHNKNSRNKPQSSSHNINFKGTWF